MAAIRPAQLSEDISFRSFRDPAGRLLFAHDRIFRVVAPAAAEEVRTFLRSEPARKMISEGRLIPTWIVEQAEPSSSQSISGIDVAAGGLVLEHERARFPSYPYEWAPLMLQAAGALTLDLAEELLGLSWGLKDATPYNVLFRGPDPVFVDWLSIQRREPLDRCWLASAQFVRTFLLPLLAHRHCSLSLDVSFANHRDGLEPEQLYRMLSPVRRFTPLCLRLVTIPSWLGASRRENATLYQPRRARSVEQANYILRSHFNVLRRHLFQVAMPHPQSPWSTYESGNSYSGEDNAQKQAFVREVCGESNSRHVLDIGCNTGTYSVIAAKGGAKVVAIDSDPAVVSALWQTARSNRLDILPLVVNIARPSPSLGWLNSECPSFLNRARGRFDAVLMLALLHHLLVTERIPLANMFELAAELTTDLFIVEFIAPEDAMFRRIVRGRDELHHDLNQKVFEAAAGHRFEITRKQRIGGSSRWVYSMHRKGK